MKRLLCLGLALCLLASILGGCGKKEDAKKSSSSTANSSALAPAAASPAPVSAAPVQKAKAVTVQADGGLNIRSEPSTDGEILGLADDGSKLPLLVEKETDGWFQIEYEGKAAYVSAEYAKVVEVTLEEYNRLRNGGNESSGLSSSSSEPASSHDSDDPGRKTSSASAATPTPQPVNNNEDGE